MGIVVVVKAGLVFLNIVLVVSGVRQASFCSAAVGQFAGVGILEVMSLVEESLLYTVYLDATN